MIKRYRENMETQEPHMALNSGLGFAKFAQREHCLLDFIATIDPPAPEPTAHELRSIRKAEKRKRRELSMLRADDFHFDFTPAPKSSDLQSLEDQMRDALGIDTPVKKDKPEVLASFEFVPTIPKTSPPPGIEQASETAKLHAKLEKQIRTNLGVPAPAKPATPIRKPAAPRTFLKRELEVILLVRDQDWFEVPFFHVEYNMTEVEAEILAGKKARGYGLKVLKLVSVTSKEIEVTVGAA
jgi:hypothetical protein